MEPRSGVAKIKPEFLLHSAPAASTSAAVDDDAAESSGKSLKRTLQPDGTEALAGADADAVGEGSARGPKAAKGEDGRAKKQRGQNKGRKFANARDDIQLCSDFAAGRTTCAFGDNCRKSHDVSAYLESKLSDLVLATPECLSSTAPFVDLSGATVRCPTFTDLGFCPQGLKCRFLAAHFLPSTEEGRPGTLVMDEKRQAELGGKDNQELNTPDQGALKQLRLGKLSLPRSEKYLAMLEGRPAPSAVPAASEEEAMNDEEEMEAASKVDADKDQLDVPMRIEEKRRLHWEGKTYLAPLTTTGNLPFRRLCVSLGADITCSEMGLATSLLSGDKGEWALTKRHRSETNFGIQVCGSKPQQLVTAAEAIVQQCDNVDFVDVNLGCPIDLVFNKGAGSALFDSPGKLGKILVGMSQSLGEIPLTVKFRMGIKDNKPIAHKLIPRFASEWGTSAMTLHGRSRQQRYSRLADWNYIKECSETLRATCEENNLPKIPIFGNGDCFSSQQYYECVEGSGVDGIMIARGALIKPWVFTEIKERREWDISATERLEFIRQYAEFGLSHWGSDTQGVNTTRRFLLESLSFTHRYVPLGLLEVVPAQINLRAEPFKGRSELETLLASSNANDWVKISEMFLGPTPDGWSFTPKHKSHAGTEDGNG